MSVGRALWVTAEPPNVHGGGGSIRQAHLLRRLARAVPTDLLVVGELVDEETASAVATVTRIPPPPIWRPGSRTVRRGRDLVRAVAPGGPPQRRDNAAARDALRPALAQRQGYDLVCLEHSGLAPLVPHPHAARWCLTMQNVESLTLAQEAELAPGWRQAWLLRRSRQQALRFERWISAACDLVITVSPEDAAALPGPSTVVPNGVDLRQFRPAPLPPTPTIVFTGTFDYLPNVDGAQWFCRHVLPLVRASLPGATVEMAGRNPSPEVLGLIGLPGVRGSWNVPDIRPHMEAARVAVVPLRCGSGTRLKALEAMALGRPVVGTSIGLAGIGVRDGVHARVVDSADEFAAALIGLLNDDEAAHHLAAHGRALAERCSWDVVGERFLRAVLPPPR